ncbi:MAG: hypothetical protein ACQEXN_03875 [Actinomycetota bacterium]
MYAALIDDSVKRPEQDITPYVLALHGDSRVLCDGSGRPVGFSVRTGPVNASESIRFGRIALLIVGRTHKSGEDHEARLDEAAAEVGLERILPLGESLPTMKPTQISMASVSQLFTVLPDGADHSLMPQLLQELHAWDGFSEVESLL